ncbi:Nucleoid occlusion protein [subsurface metagenome]
MPIKQEVPELKMIDMESLLPPQEDVRILISDEYILELAESMRQVGLLQSITVDEQDGRHEIVIGHRRFLAAKKLGWTEIRAEVGHFTVIEKALMRATENLQRENLSPIEEGYIYIGLQDEHGFSLRDIADRMGKSYVTVKNRLDLLKMDDEVQKAIQFKKISPAVAVELSKIDDQKIMYRYLNIAIGDGVTAQIMARWADDWRKALAYNPDRGGGGGQQPEATRELKSFAMCEFCKGPVEYKDVHNLPACPKCNDLIVSVVAQGYFKEGEKPQ